MRKILSYILVALVLTACSPQDPSNDPCANKSDAQCYDQSDDPYSTEKNASVKIAGLDSAFLASIIKLWDETYPEEAGLITPNEIEHNAIDSLSLKALDYDIVYASEEVASYYLDRLGKLDDNLKSVYNHANVVDGTIDILKDYIMPFTSDGAAFMFNKTMLEVLGIDVKTDKNQDGMPDSIDSWEEIFDISDFIATKHPKYKKKEVLITFPFALNEASLSYFMLTSNNFRLFSKNDGLNAGFESDEFLAALGFIEEASEHIFVQKSEVIKKKNVYTPFDSSGYIYRWDKVYTNEVAPFGVVASWMDIDTYMKSLKSQFVIAPTFPSYQKTPMTSFVTNSGFVYKNTTKNKVATFKVLNFLQSPSVYQLMVDETNLVPFYYDNVTIDFKDKPNTRNKMLSNSLGDNIPLIALPDNIYMQAFSSYFEIDINSVIRDLWDKKISKEEAQNQLVVKYKKWYQEQCNIEGLAEELKDY